MYARHLVGVAVLCFTLVAGSATTTRAFSYAEHCRISNHALSIALDHMSRTRPLRPSLVDSLRTLANRPCKSGTENLSYGDLVALGDFALSPVDLYVGVQNDDARAQFLAGVLPTRVLDALGESLIDNLATTHLNADHFQDRGLFAYWFWHRQAASIAAHEQNLFSALLLNAFGEHFLQDHFAPGHVRTPRRNFHDAPAAGMHDHYNEVGLLYRPANTQELAQFGVAGLPPALQATLAHSGLSLGAWLEVRERDGIRFYGDDLLEGNQELFITLVVARSVTDILESFTKAEPVNSFEDYTWRGYRILSAGGGRQRLAAPEAHLPYGGYHSESDSLKRVVFSGSLIVAAGPQAVLADKTRPRLVVGLEFLGLGSPGGGWITGSDGNALNAPQFGVPVGYQAVLGDGSFAHGPSARAVFPIRRMDTQVGVVGGYRWYHLDGRTESGGVIGGEIEMGYGLAFIGLRATREHAFTTEGRFRPVLALTTTVTVGGPMSRIRKVLR